MRYWPNPAHKRETTVAGPPAWRPNKDPCPDDLAVEERDELLATSLPKDGAAPHSRRYNARRTDRGLELYEAKWHADVDGEPEFHGHPTRRVPGRVLRALRDEGKITVAEYRKLVKEFG